VRPDPSLAGVKRESRDRNSSALIEGIGGTESTGRHYHMEVTPLTASAWYQT
jgi:hypothetical protein